MVFGLFKPPRFHIRQRIPVHAHMTMATIEAYSDMQLEDWDEAPRNHGAAFILSVWACNAAAAGELHLPMKDYQYIQNAGVLSIGWLSESQKMEVHAVLDELMEKGMIVS